MQLSKQGDYAIRTMLGLGRVYPESLSTKEIATKQDIPKPFLNKIIQSLAKSGLVQTTRGPHGGVKLWLSPDKITLRDIIEAIDGPIIINRCLMDYGICNRQPRCAVHRAFDKARQIFLDELEKNTLDTLLTEEFKIDKEVVEKENY